MPSELNNVCGCPWRFGESGTLGNLGRLVDLLIDNHERQGIHIFVVSLKDIIVKMIDTSIGKLIFCAQDGGIFKNILKGRLLNMCELNIKAATLGHPDILSIFLAKTNKLHTTQSWEFLGLETHAHEVPNHSLWNKGVFGEDIIIATIDSGVWPESSSFNDEGYGEVPPQWRGICQQDSSENPVHCNRKLIGVRYFNRGYNLKFGPKATISSGRDVDGHGTHTLSTAGGHFVEGVGVQGFESGTAKGGSPRSRLAAYKVCWEHNCDDVDIWDAFISAITDGVDVISVSLGPTDKEDSFLESGTAIGALHAIKAGITVVCSAGNEGPYPESVKNTAPWIFTAAASTIARDVTELPNKNLRRTRAPMMANFSSRGPGAFESGILKPDITAPGVKIIAAYSEDPRAKDGSVPFKALSGTSMSCPHVAGVVGLLKKISPKWSSSAVRSAIMTTATTKDNLNRPIQEVSGGDATPFTYGAGHLRPNTAMDPGLVYELTMDDYYSYLCGRGYKEDVIMKIAKIVFTCPTSFRLEDFNYPSFVIPVSRGSSTTIRRKLKNVGTPATYKVEVEKPMGVSIVVSPTILMFGVIGEELTFNVTVELIGKKTPDYIFGQLIWTDNIHFVRSPLVVKLEELGSRSLRDKKATERILEIIFGVLAVISFFPIVYILVRRICTARGRTD